MEKDQYSNNRRIRANRHIRELASDVVLSHRDFIQPLFLDQSVDRRTPLNNLNEVNADTPFSIIDQIGRDLETGISKFLIFPVPEQKSTSGFDYSFFTNALHEIRKKFGASIWIAADVCLCAYTSHGHCGILNAEGTRVLNKETVAELSRYATALAEAGADCIAPSDMMDGRVAAIRDSLDQKGFDHIAIMSYSSKLSSQFYGPFRDACKSSPAGNENLKDRKTYQISAFNSADAMASAIRDISEGADMIMVKPALPYLDVLTRLKAVVHKPIAVYQVSGEYQSIELLASNGIAERQKAHTEVWTSMRRAGASIIISYVARHAKKWIDEIEY